MIISIIVAMDQAGCIGKDNRLPWRLSADLARFKSLTMGHHLIMGRRTYQSIGRLLPGRTMVILTRDRDPAYKIDGAFVVHSLQEALAFAQGRDERETFVIGGAEIFSLALPHTDRIYLTQLHTRVDCDVYFPSIDMRQWLEQESFFQPADERNQFAFTYRLLYRP